MKCDGCPYLESLDAKRCESNERIDRAQELAGKIVVAEAQNALTAADIALLPEGTQKEVAQAALERDLSVLSLSRELVGGQPNAEAFFLDQLDNFVQLAVSQCANGPSIKRKLFGDDKMVCNNDSSVVGNEFRR